MKFIPNFVIYSKRKWRDQMTKKIPQIGDLIVVGNKEYIFSLDFDNEPRWEFIRNVYCCSLFEKAFNRGCFETKDEYYYIRGRSESMFTGQTMNEYIKIKRCPFCGKKLYKGEKKKNDNIS